MGAEDREAAAPQGVQPAGAGGVQDRLNPLAGQREDQFLAGDQEERAETGNRVGRASVGEGGGGQDNIPLLAEMLQQSPRYAPAADPFVEEGLSDLRGGRVGQGDKLDPTCVMVNDNEDVVVAPAGERQGPKKVDGDKFKWGAYR
ncbi:hypothetical protein Emag_007900 [Eimeria magna]